MPDFFPFRGTRYRGFTDLSPVVAPPYDVIDEEERARLEETNPHNAVRLILPRPDGPHDPYAAAAHRWRAWLTTGVLHADPHPVFYAYTMRAADESTVPGIIGALALPTRDGEVLGHEHTLARARADRLDLLRATRANLDPIWCLSLDPGMTEVIAAAGGGRGADGSVAVDDERVTHTIAAVDDAEMGAAITSAVAAAPLMIADGHHRYETARAYRDERPGDAGAQAIMAFVSGLDERHLHVGAIHRVLGDVPGDLRTRLGTHFTVRALVPNTPEGVHALTTRMRSDAALGLVDADGLALLVPNARGAEVATAAVPPALRGVDAARFEAAVLPLVEGVRLDYRSDAETVAALVRSGRAPAAVLLRAPDVEEIRAVALAGQRMPQKTTFFVPKPRTGMVFRDLEL